MSWNLRGTYFEACNCHVACPCVFLSPPTEGECRVLVAWHVDQGQDGAVDLAGLNVAMAIHSPGHMMQTKWRAALYLDARAKDAQKQALTRISGIVSAEIEAIPGQAGDVTVSGHPLCVAPGEAAVVAKSGRLDYGDHAMTWAISERNGFYSPFAYEGG